MAPINMPIQPVQIRQQVIAAMAPLKPIRKEGKRYGRRQVRTAGGEKLPAGRRHRVDTASAAQFDDDLWDVIEVAAEEVIEADVLENFAEEMEPQPTIPRTPLSTPKPKEKEPAVLPGDLLDFPSLNDEDDTSIGSPKASEKLAIRERSISEMSAGSFAEAMTRQLSGPPSPAPKPKAPAEEPSIKEVSLKILEEIGAASPKPKSKNLNIIDEDDEAWMVVGKKGQIAPEKPKPKEAPAPDYGDIPYDAEEMKDSRRRNEWRPTGDAHTGRRAWKVDPSEKLAAIEAAQVRKAKKAGKLEEVEPEDEDGTEQKKRTRADRKKDRAQQNDDDNSSVTTEEEQDQEQAPTTPKRGHTKRLGKRTRVRLVHTVKHH